MLVWGDCIVFCLFVFMFMCIMDGEVELKLCVD